MKKLMSLLLAMIMVVSLAGCSIFTSGGENEENVNDIKITETYTFCDPEEIEYDTRSVLYDATGESLQGYEYQGYKATSEVYVIYAKEDKALAQYIVTVFESADVANQYYTDMGGEEAGLDIHDDVVITYADATALDAVLVAYVSYGMLEEATASNLVELYTSLGMAEYTPAE